ncbi:MAG: hypothetical protein FD156_1647 [Nitrospirae bacterium]|nr:MAG: hypothetical protein FD156_1647 [Nitrospirota bacterium]
MMLAKEFSNFENFIIVGYVEKDGINASLLRLAYFQAVLLYCVKICSGMLNRAC